MKVSVAHSCLTLCDSMCVHGILQVTILEWVAIPSPGDLPDPGTEPGISCITGRFLYHLSFQGKLLKETQQFSKKKRKKKKEKERKKTDCYNTLSKTSSFQPKVTRHVIK